MIRQLALMAVVAISFASAVKIETRTGDKDFALLQKTVWDLLWHPNQPDKVHTDLYKTGTGWDLLGNIEKFSKKEVVEEFWKYYKQGRIVPRGRVYSPFISWEAKEEARLLFNLFYYANDVRTFLNTAAWARIHVNEGLYTYAFYLAVFHRLDTREINLPSPHEIGPNYFFNHDVISQAYYIKMTHSPHDDVSKPETHVVYANYTKPYHGDTSESRLNYFTEDVGLNEYYFYCRHEFPPFLKSDVYFKHNKDYRGQLYFYMHRGLLNRYDLERLSNDLPITEYFDWEQPFVPGYTSALAYRQGIFFPQRKSWSTVPADKFKYLQKLREFESRIAAVANSGVVFTKEGKFETIPSKDALNVFSNLVEGNADSLNYDYYGSLEWLSRGILGSAPRIQKRYEAYPSALEHFTTSLRDPAFWRIVARYNELFTRFQDFRGPYTYDELAFKNVKIESVAIDRLTTYMDWSDSLISNIVGVHDHKDAESIVIKARQQRLNHKPFTYHVTVISDIKKPAIVRCHLGPKYDHFGNELDFSDNYHRFYELDRWVVELNAGINKIERRSIDAELTVEDRRSSDYEYKKILEGVESGQFTYTPRFLGYPNRLVLPKGKPEGLEFNLFCHIGEFNPETAKKFETHLAGEIIDDHRTMGFPLDRPNLNVEDYDNMYIRTVPIYFKDDLATSS